jgi:glycosyltransferase involved in cell wall biosynthesis
MISIIVPVYRVEPYLRQCLDSILNQTYRDIEVLLIDDGSPDKCGRICKEYADIDERIRLFHTDNKGLSSARNLGLQEARGEYIGFVDSDDWLEPKMYSILLQQLETTEADISACGVRCEYLNSHNDYSIVNGFYTGKNAIRVFVCELSNGVWNKLYKKKCWAGICFPENHTYEEIATLYKVMLKANSLSCIPLPLYHYRMRKGSIVHTKSNQNIIDHWTAVYHRYLYLSSLQFLKNDHELIDCLEKQVASAAIKTWVWTLRISKGQRDYDFLQKISFFVKNRFPVFGRKEWPFFLRIGILFPRYANDFSFFVLHLITNIYNTSNFVIKFICKNKKKEIFH